MDVREKLEVIAHLGDHISYKEDIGICYDSALAKVIEDAYVTLKNGVTVQDEAKLYWKPVKPGEWNLTCSACDSHLGCREGAKHCPECGAKFVYPKAIMPKPPKGE